jgi:hypothetical protein
MIKILINNEEVVSNSNLTITEEMLTTSSTILKNCYPKSWELDKDYTSRYYFPKDYSKCKIYEVDGEDETLIFCGVVKNTGNISLNPREPHFVDLQILDFKTLLSEGETLNYVIYNKTITEAITQVIDSVSDYGFVLGTINIQNPNDILGAYSTLDKTAYDVFQYIAEITQSRWTTRMIDENTVAIDFFDPLLVENKKQIESTETYYCENKIIDISFNYSTGDYRNKQIMTSDEVLGNINQTETKFSDGYTTTFVCENKIGNVNYLTVNGNSMEVITKNQKEQGYSGDFVYTPGENIITALINISAGSILVIDYYPIVKGREIILNTPEISRINTQTNRKGTISRYENRNDTTNSLELAKIGQSYIKYKSSAEVILTVKTTKDLFNVGDIVEYDSLVNDLDKEYMIKRKVIDMYLNANEIFYTYELTSNFNSEQAINYFDNQRAKTIGNIGEGEAIIRDIDIENTANIIFYDTEVEEETISSISELDFQLDGALV